MSDLFKYLLRSQKEEVRNEGGRSKKSYVLRSCFFILTSAFLLLTSAFFVFLLPSPPYLIGKHQPTLPCSLALWDYTDPGRNLDVCAYLSHAGAAACS